MSLTFGVPVLVALRAALSKCFWWRAQKGHHLGKMLFIVQVAILRCAKEPTALKQIPDLIVHYQLDSRRQ